MTGPRNRVVQVSRFGDPKGLEVVDAPLPTAGRGEVRVRVLASSLNYTEVLIRRHLYPQTMRLRPPFVMGYDVVGEIVQLGEGVRNFQIGDRVADMLRGTIDVFERNDPKAVKAIESADNAVDRLYEAIKLYLIQTSRTELGEEDGKRYIEILTFTTNLEHIGDIVDKNLMELATKKIRNRYAFSPEGMAELRAFHARVLDNLRLALNVFTTRDITLARRLVAEKTAMREAETRAADSHYARLREGRTESIETSSIHMDVIRDLKRINGHLASVAYPILEAAGELADTRLKEAQPLIRAPAGS